MWWSGTLSGCAAGSNCAVLHLPLVGGFLVISASQVGLSGLCSVAGRGAWARFMRHGTKGLALCWDFVPLHHVDCPCPPSCLRRDGMRTCAPDALATPPLLSRALLLLSPPSSPRLVWLWCLLVLIFVRVLCLVRFWCCFWCPCLLVLFGCFCSLLPLCSVGALPSLAFALSSLPACATQD